MSRRQNRIEMSSHRLKLEESTLHNELRRFLEFQTLRIYGCQVRINKPTSGDRSLARLFGPVRLVDPVRLLGPVRLFGPARDT